MSRKKANRRTPQAGRKSQVHDPMLAAITGAGDTEDESGLLDVDESAEATLTDDDIDDMEGAEVESEGFGWSGSDSLRGEVSLSGNADSDDEADDGDYEYDDDESGGGWERAEGTQNEESDFYTPWGDREGVAEVLDPLMRDKIVRWEVSNLVSDDGIVYPSFRFRRNPPKLIFHNESGASFDVILTKKVNRRLLQSLTVVDRVWNDEDPFPKKKTFSERGGAALEWVLRHKVKGGLLVILSGLFLISTIGGFLNLLNV